MEKRAKEAGYDISRSAISDYEHGRIEGRPGRERVEALAAALGFAYPEVAAAVEETYSLGEDTADDANERRKSQRAEAWLRLTDQRSDVEVDELLLIVEQVLRMRDLDAPK
jgi:transcriptional regulator with XRE-family HTH domain